MYRTVIATLTIVIINIYFSIAQGTPSEDSLVQAALQIQQNEMAFMYIDTENDQLRHVTYAEDDNSLMQTSSYSESNSNSGPTNVVGGYFFGDEYGETAVYSDGKGIKFDLRFELGINNNEAVTTINGRFPIGNSIVHMVSGNFTGDKKEELIIFYNDNTGYKASIYTPSLSIDDDNDAEILPHASGTFSSIAYSGSDVFALDIDNDGYDEVAIVDWVSNRLYVEVLDVNGSGNIYSKYVKEIFSTSVAECLWLNVMGNGDNGESFNYSWADISLAGGDFVDEFAGEELVVGAQFSYSGSCCDQNELNQGLYLFPLRESLDGSNNPTMIVPNWCSQTYNPMFDFDYAVTFNYRPGLDMDAGDIAGSTEDEVVLAYGSTISGYNVDKATDIGNGYFALKIGTKVFGSSLNSDAFISSDNSKGPGFHANHFLSVGNIDPILANDQNSYKEEIFFGANKFNDCPGCDEKRTEQSFTLSIIGIDDQNSVEFRGSLSNLFPLDEENEKPPRLFSLSLVDFDGGGLRFDYQANSDNYDISLGLPPVVHCGNGQSGGSLDTNELSSTINNIIANTSFENFHILPQQTNTTLSLFVGFNSSILSLAKTVKIKHYRTELGTGNKELATLETYNVSANEPSLVTNFFFEPVSGSINDALLITVETGSGDNFSSVIIPIFVTGIDYTVPVLGTAIAPEIPKLVLHDPPGDLSSSAFSEGVSFCRTVSESITDAQGISSEFNVKLGIKGDLGFIYTTSYEFYVQFSVGMEIETTQSMEQSYEQCITTTTGFQTSDLPDVGSIGENGDIFIGYGERLVYGVEKNYFLDSVTCTMDSVLTFAYASDGATNFVYTALDIQNDIIAQQNVLDNIASTAADKAIAQNQIDVWTKILANNSENIASATNLNESITMTGGGQSTTSTTEVSTTEISKLTYDIVLETSDGVSTLLDVGGSGFSGGVEFTLTNSKGIGSETSSGSTKMISYTLIDDDSGDLFNVDIYRDREYGTPLFKLANGSKTSCPYEGGIKRDQPNLSSDSQCSFQNGSKELFVDDLDPNLSAVFDLNICNNSAESRSYILELSNNTNGANVSVANTALNNVNSLIEFTLDAGACQSPILTIGRNPALPMNGQNGYDPSYDVYNDLTFLLYPKCGGSPIEDEADIAKISVTFGRSGDYLFGDEDCDGILNIDDPDTCNDMKILNADSGEIDGVYNAKSNITIQSNTLIGAAKNILLNAPEVLIEHSNEIPLSTIFTISSSGCGD